MRISDSPTDAQPTISGRLIAAGAALITVGLLAGGATRPLLVVVGVIASVAAHEAGHWIAARRGGMTVTDAFIGMGPRVWARKVGRTTIGINAFPVGAYVKVPDMNSMDTTHGTPGGYALASFGAQARMLFAGPATNAAIAVLLLWGTFAFAHYEPVSDRRIDHIVADSPAAKAGLAVGDRVVQVDGLRVTKWEQFRDYIRSHPGATLKVTVQRGEATHTVAARAVSVDGEGFLGLGPRIHRVGFRPGAAVVDAARGARDITTQTFTALGRFATGAGVRAVVDPPRPASEGNPASESETRFLSPVGLVQVASNTSGLADVTLLLGLINMSLAIFNLLPLPPLDGGLLAVCAYEAGQTARRGRRHQIDYRRLVPVVIGVVSLLVVIAAASLYLDVSRPLVG